MVALSETTTIALPADDVWPLLSDPALVASCIPGASLSPDQGDGLWRGSVRVKFGPTVAVFRGEASLVFDQTARTCTIEGRGIDGRGASRALAKGTVKVTGKETTELAIFFFFFFFPFLFSFPLFFSLSLSSYPHLSLPTSSLLSIPALSRILPQHLCIAALLSLS